MTRPLYQIAKEIRQDWKKPYFGAVPYLEALEELTSIHERYGLDSGISIVLYFLGNAQTWRGETARRIKAELKAIVKEYERSQNQSNVEYEAGYSYAAGYPE
jgi:hypothetical protein